MARLHDLNKTIFEANGDELGGKIEDEKAKWDALGLKLKENNLLTEELSKSLETQKNIRIRLLELADASSKRNLDTIIDEADKVIKLNDAYSEGKISLEKYNEEKEKLSNESQKNALLSQLSDLNDQITLLNSAKINLDEEGQKSAEQNIKNLQSEVEKLRQQLSDLGIKIDTTDADKAREKIKKTFDSIKELTSDVASAMSDIAGIGYDNQKAAVEQLEAAQQKRYEKEVANINNSTLSEQDKANKLKVLEAERQAQSEANDRKQKKIEAERAKFQRAMDIANIISSTAVAVVAALGSKPWGPWNFALAATVGTLGLAQLAKAVATKIPEYAEGTDNHPGGLAIVGEGKNRELIQTPDGKSFIADKPVLMNLPKKTKVIPYEEMQSAYANSISNLIAVDIVRNAKIVRAQESMQAWEIAKWQARQTARMLNNQNRKNITNVNTLIDFSWTKYVNKYIYGRDS